MLRLLRNLDPDDDGEPSTSTSAPRRPDAWAGTRQTTATRSKRR